MTGSAIVLAAILPAILPAAGQPGGVNAATAGAPITIRTEQYPRPPYSGATYYVYERGGVPICTKLEVCNKYGDCAASYYAGRYRAAEDRETGAPHATSPAAPIPAGKLKRHVCLVRYRLIRV
jgi:hypothetical protein